MLFRRSRKSKEFDASVQKIDYMRAAPALAFGAVLLFGICWVGIVILFFLAAILNRLVTDRPLSVPPDIQMSPFVVAALVVSSLWIGAGLEQEAHGKAEERRKTWYQSYINSPGWEDRKSLALLRAQGRCQICNNPYNLHAHHRTYSRLGIEQEEDITVLCRECHSVFHAGGRMPDQPS